MDAQQILKRSRIFYREHNLPSWRAALPKVAQVDPDELAYAQRNDFTHGFAFPPFAHQMQTLDLLMEETARKQAPALADNQQYGLDLILSDTWSKEANGKILQRTDDLGRRLDGPYFLFYSPKPVQNAWGRTGKQIGELFRAKDWQGLTVPEYFVLQRHYAEHFGDHRFFEATTDSHPAHWLWLVDSMTDSACTVVMGKARGLNLQACPIGNRDSRRAALAGRAVAMQSIMPSVRQP